MDNSGQNRWLHALIGSKAGFEQQIIKPPDFGCLEVIFWDSIALNILDHLNQNGGIVGVTCQPPKSGKM